MSWTCLVCILNQSGAPTHTHTYSLRQHSLTLASFLTLCRFCCLALSRSVSHKIMQSLWFSFSTLEMKKKSSSCLLIRSVNVYCIWRLLYRAYIYPFWLLFWVWHREYVYSYLNLTNCRISMRSLFSSSSTKTICGVHIRTFCSILFFFRSFCFFFRFVFWFVAFSLAQFVCFFFVAISLRIDFLVHLFLALILFKSIFNSFIMVLIIICSSRKEYIFFC